MTKEEKKLIVGELTEKLSNSGYFYVVDASGMTVEEINLFRSICFEKGIEYKVVKNTLINKALDSLEGDFTEFNDKVLKGFSGVLIASAEASSIPAKVIKEYRKKTGSKDMPAFKGASIEASFYFGEENLEALSKLKSKDELLGEVVTLLQSPAKNVISALKSGGDTIAGLVKALSEKEGAE